MTTRPSASAPIATASMQRAENSQPRSNAAAASAGCGVPTTTISSATPSTAPSWRLTELSEVAVPKRSPGADATAAPLSSGNVRPAPMPSTSIPGSHSATNAGRTPMRSSM